jgi:phospholipid/cholesterol/gamma-HCH transport system permease protein
VKKPKAAPAKPPVHERALTELGGMLQLAGQTAVRSVRAPRSYAPEFLSELIFVLRICFFPLILSAFALSFGPAGIQASNFFGLFGSFDRLGGAYVIVVIRLFAPLVTAIVLAGVAGTAICADLGARQVREEIPAIQVLGIDPVQALVVPRVLALIIASILLSAFAVVVGLLGAVVVVKQNNASLGPFWATFFSNATPIELGAAVIKCALYGTIIALVSCYKGLTVSGGAEGVGRAVNRAVVIAFLAIGFADYFSTQLLLATHPGLSEVRG